MNGETSDGEGSSQIGVEFVGGETKIGVPIYLCGGCREDLEDDIFYEQGMVAFVTDLESEGFLLSFYGLCSEEQFPKISSLVRDRVGLCHADHGLDFGDNIVSGPEDKKNWQQIWEDMHKQHQEIIRSLKDKPE